MLADRFATQSLAILASIEEIARQRTRCKRKGVGCAVYHVRPVESESHRPLTIVTDAVNGTFEQHEDRTLFECSNEVGKCGCMHAEQRAILRLLERGASARPLVMFCTYSPCTNCANIVNESGLIAGFVYDILTEHDTRGEKRLRATMPVFTAAELRTLVDDPKLENAALNAALARWTTLSRTT